MGQRRHKVLPSVQAIKAIFDYDPETGVLSWKRRHGEEPGVAIFNVTWAGKPAGSPHQGGYRQVTFISDGMKYKALVHRICFAIHNGYFPVSVDHRNNIRTDNRAKNLRDAGTNGNQCNRSKINSRSGFKGVYAHKRTGKFFSQILSKGHYEFLGIHETEEACARAYDAAALRLHGEFARTNASLNLIGA